MHSPHVTVAEPALPPHHLRRWHRFIVHGSLPLHLEPLAPEHAQAFFYQYRDPRIAALTQMPWFSTEAELRRWMRTTIALRERERFALMHRDLGFVGYLSLRLDPPVASFGFWIGVDHQGRGFGAASARLLCEHAHAQGIDRIEASAFSSNLPSMHALTRAGFRASGQCGDGTDERRLFVRQAVGNAAAWSGFLR